MELFGLKNENGKDVRLIVTDNPYTHPHPIIKVEAIEPNEIVADEPKELPKTIDELKQLILGYYYDYYKCHNVNDFLEERGYKIE